MSPTEPNQLYPSAAPADAGPRERFDWMYHEIRRRICVLEYEPGLRLSEEVLAAEFGVSRTPLRRVLTRLENEGLVLSVHGVGTFVTDVGIETLAQTYRLRLELASLISRLDPVQVTPECLAEFAALAARASALAEAPDAEAFAQLNIDFMQAYIALTANEPLREVSRRLYYQTHRIWLQSVYRQKIDLAEEMQIFDHEMKDFCRALGMGDLDAATNIHRAHISMSFVRMSRDRKVHDPSGPAASEPQL